MTVSAPATPSLPDAPCRPEPPRTRSAAASAGAMPYSRAKEDQVLLALQPP